MNKTERIAQIKVFRGQEKGTGHYDTWEVPYYEGMSVLDALLWVRGAQDPSLAIRYSCLNANACKECSAVINGKPGYLCTARLDPSRETTCDPLPRKRLMRDLVVDITAPGEETTT